MGEVIHAPFRAEKGVVVRWVDGWSRYVVQVFGSSPWLAIDGSHRGQWRDTCEDARILAAEMAKLYGLPLFDLTAEGRAA